VTLCLAEELSYWDRGVAVSFPGPGLGEPSILSMGTLEQKRRFLGPFVEPDRPRWGSFAMTEPGAGSDVAGIEASARKQGRHWVLNGAKSFAANASRADWIVVFATVDRSLGREGHRAFVVERGTPGLGNFAIERKMGLKAYESTSFTLEDCRVPEANLLGGEEHYARRAGFRGAMKSFNATRPMVAAMAVGIGRAALDEALAFAREHGLLADARVRDRLERIRRRLRAARLLCWRAAWLADRERPNILEASMAKAVAPAVALEAATQGMEILGEVGARGDHLIEKLFRDVKALDIVEGTGQIQRIIMARRLVKLPSERG
jgi:acyl-CoA dehydrogenase